jgi:hypothetical protein
MLEALTPLTRESRHSLDLCGKSYARENKSIVSPARETSQLKADMCLS